MISVENLTFSYGKDSRVIDDLSFHVPQGSIFGFLGANGSGKTTTIRLMLGLCKPAVGRVCIGGVDMATRPTQAYAAIGALIEHPSLYGGLSAEENLLLNARYYGVKPDRVPVVLNTVGLTHVSKRKTQTFSLGMKQRLGLAISLLHDPSLLILDEPLNGLDPKGIAEIRELLLRVGKEEGKTIFLSSHLLGEIESTCDSICIIDKGKRLFAGSIEAFRTTMSGCKQYRITCDRPNEAHCLVSPTLSPCLSDDGTILVVQSDDREQLPVMIRRLTEAGIRLYEVTPMQNNLEALYLTLTH